MKEIGKSRFNGLGAVLAAWGCMAFFSSEASGPCDPPPYDPLVPVSTAEAAMEMDAWAFKALRRDVRGGTCEEQREVVDILLVRWLQAHPDIVISFEGEEAAEWLSESGEFLVRVKAEAWAELKGMRPWFPRAWGKASSEASPKAMLRREAFVQRTVERLGKAGKK